MSESYFSYREENEPKHVKERPGHVSTSRGEWVHDGFVEELRQDQ